MTLLPKELQDIIIDYKQDLDMTEKSKPVLKELIKRVERLNELRSYDYQYWIENDCCNCLDINNEEYNENHTDWILGNGEVDCYRIYEGQWNCDWNEKRNIHIGG